MPTAPTFWETIPELLAEEAKTQGVAPISLGYGRATPVGADVLVFRTMQEK